MDSSPRRDQRAAQAPLGACPVSQPPQLRIVPLQPKGDIPADTVPLRTSRPVSATFGGIAVRTSGTNPTKNAGPSAAHGWPGGLGHGVGRMACRHTRE